MSPVEEPHSEDALLAPEEPTAVRASRWPRTAVALAAVLGLTLGAVLLGSAHPGNAPAGAPGAPANIFGQTLAFIEKASKPKKCEPERMKATPSLFCFAVMMANSSEEALMKSQLERFVGLFSCNEYAVISKGKRWLGKDECGADVFTWKEGLPDLQKGFCDIAGGQMSGCTNSFLNVNMFQIVWDSLIFSDMLWKHDWIAKMDPDTVFMPDRLRLHVTGQTGEPPGLVGDPNEVPGDEKFFTTCWYNAPTGLLYGSLEVFSRQAIWKYHEQNATCKGLDWQNWGEDLYMQNCMEALQVPSVHDYHLVGDDSCEGLESGDCTDASKAAYHPRKDVDSWMSCIDTATR